MIFKGILPKAIAGGAIKTVTPQEGGSTEPTGALARLIELNPEIIEKLKNPEGEKSSPNNSITELPFYDEFRAYQKRLDEEARNKGEFRVGTQALTPVEYEGSVYTFGGGLEAADFKNFLKMRQQQPLLEQNLSEPANPPATQYPLLTQDSLPIQDPFQRQIDAPPVARALPMQERNQIAAGPALNPVDRSSLFSRRRPAANLVLTPAEALAMARNPFNRSR